MPRFLEFLQRPDDKAQAWWRQNHYWWWFSGQHGMLRPTTNQSFAEGYSWTNQETTSATQPSSCHLSGPWRISSHFPAEVFRLQATRTKAEHDTWKKVNLCRTSSTGRLSCILLLDLFGGGPGLTSGTMAGRNGFACCFVLCYDIQRRYHGAEKQNRLAFRCWDCQPWPSACNCRRNVAPGSRQADEIQEQLQESENSFFYA